VRTSAISTSRTSASRSFQPWDAHPGTSTRPAALGSRLPVELVEVPDGHRAFDVLDDSDASRDAIRRVLGFLREHLTA
jgi:hypothetical protein